MLRKKGAKCVSQERFKTIYDMHSIGVRTIDMPKHFKMPHSTVCCIIRRYKSIKVAGKKKIGRPCKLSPRGMRLLQKYATEFCLEPLYVITARSNAYTKLQISESTVKRTLKRMQIGT